jgi:hypothetical protein
VAKVKRLCLLVQRMDKQGADAAARTGGEGTA